jgi:hypothetical protein
MHAHRVARGRAHVAKSKTHSTKRKTTKKKSSGMSALVAGLLGAAGGAAVGYGARTVQDVVSQPNNPLTSAWNKLVGLVTGTPAQTPTSAPTAGYTVPLPATTGTINAQGGVGSQSYGPSVPPPTGPDTGVVGAVPGAILATPVVWTPPYSPGLQGATDLGTMQQEVMDFYNAQ